MTRSTGSDVAEGDLVALALPAGDEFAATVQRVWQSGAAVAPIDPAAPSAWTATVLEVLAPTVLVTTEGVRRLPGGVPVQGGDALVMCTSGSSGRPKAAVHTHASLAAGAASSAAALGAAGPEVVWISALPLFHIGGFSVLTRAWASDAGLVTLARFDADAVMAHARAVRAEGRRPFISLVATALARVDATLFERILLGGAAVPPERPANTVATYGMTESGAGVVYEGVPLPGVEVAVSGVDAGGVGRILLRAPSLARACRDGAWEGPLPTVVHEGRPFLDTGDLGRFLPTGRLEVVGRAGDVIVTGGEKVHPAQVEAVVATLPGVAACRVRGVADPDWGERVVAELEADPNVPDRPDLARVRAAVKAVLPAAWAPREVRWVDGLPRGALGKVRRV